MGPLRLASGTPSTKFPLLDSYATGDPTANVSFQN